MVESYDRIILQMEQHIEQHARDFKRFASEKDFVSYSRLVCGTNQSGGKDFGGKGRKMGNPYLKRAFMQAAVLCKRPIR